MAAFEGVPGITNISPVNFENKKTRDARCKGFAFVDFKTLKDANRYPFFFSLSVLLHTMLFTAIVM